MRLGLFGAALLAGTAILPAYAQEAAKEIQPEEITNVKIPAGTEMLFSMDLALNHVVDGRIYAMDAKTLKPIGIIGTGSLGMAQFPQVRKTSMSRRRIFRARRAASGRILSRSIPARILPSRRRSRSPRTGRRR